MSLPADYHIHTRLCRHAGGEPEQYIAHAVAIGIDEVGFADHNPMPADGFDDWRMLQAELDQYIELVAKARRDFPNVRVLLGLEMDFIPGYEEWIRDLAHRHPWDFIIGSVHYIEPGWDIDNPGKIDFWKRRDVAEVWIRYFELLMEATESRLFDVIGHVDLCKKFGFVPDRDVTDQINKFISSASRSGVAIELNTAGLRKQCQEIYPGRWIVQAAFRSGIPITFGSDAHEPGDVGWGFDSAVTLARSCGYRHALRFANRQRIVVPL